MNSLNLKRNNSIIIYREILSGNNTISEISRTTGISVLTVTKLIDDMMKRELLEIYKHKEDNVGRRKNRYRLSNKYFVIYIEKGENCFSVFGVSANYQTLFNFEYQIDSEKMSPQEALYDLIVNNIKFMSCYGYCLKVFVSCENMDNFSPIEGVIFTNKEQIIATAYSDCTKTCLFEINDKCILSLYSHLHTTNESVETITRIISFDEICTFQGNLHFEKLNSLKKIVQRYIEKII